MIISFLVNAYVFLKQHLSDDNFFSCKNICFPKTTLALTPIPEGQGLLDFSQLSGIGAEEPGE